MPTTTHVAQFFIIRFQINGELKTMLLAFEEYRDHVRDGDHKKDDFSYYLPPTAKAFKEVGQIQVMGDVLELDSQYVSD